MRRITTAAILAFSTVSAAGAQQDRASRFMDNCRRGRDDYAQFCEVREFSLPTMKGLVVDGRENGGITIHGWDRAEIKVVAMVQAQSENESEASAIATAEGTRSVPGASPTTDHALINA